MNRFKINKQIEFTNMIQRNQTHLRILFGLTAVAVALTLSLPLSAEEPKPDAELLRLEKEMTEAITQKDITMASGKILEYWDKKLAEVESHVAQKLTAEEKVQFEASKKRFVEYRKKEVEFRTSFSGRGTIGGFTANSEYSSITRHRIKEMKELLAGPLAQRVDEL